jgi:hypothetical protein
MVRGKYEAKTSKTRIIYEMKLKDKISERNRNILSFLDSAKGMLNAFEEFKKGGNYLACLPASTDRVNEAITIDDFPWNIKRIQLAIDTAGLIPEKIFEKSSGRSTASKLN